MSLRRPKIVTSETTDSDNLKRDAQLLHLNSDLVDYRF